MLRIVCSFRAWPVRDNARYSQIRKLRNFAIGTALSNTSAHPASAREGGGGPRSKAREGGPGQVKPGEGAGGGATIFPGEYYPPNRLTPSPAACKIHALAAHWSVGFRILRCYLGPTTPGGNTVLLLRRKLISILAVLAQKGSTLESAHW